MSTNLRRFIQHEIKLTYLHNVIYNKKIKAQYYFEEKKEALFILFSFLCKNSLKVITVDEQVNIDILCNKLVTRELCGLYNLFSVLDDLYKQYLHPYAIMFFERFKCNRIFLPCTLYDDTGRKNSRSRLFFPIYMYIYTFYIKERAYE